MSTPPAVLVRRDAWTLPANDKTLEAYAHGVKVMQARPASDPTSWAFQAAMHGTHAANPPATANLCQHGTWFFVSWHRMYLYYFESIVRAAIVADGGSPTWALPYWNYGIAGPHATIPKPFRSPTVTGGGHNPLYISQRAPGINSGAALPAAVTTSAFAISRPSFTGSPEFGGGITLATPSPGGGHFWSHTGRLEQTPHNDVHVTVGGSSGWMADPATAAQDPIFWLHHSNIDRLWSAWTAGAGHTNPTDPKWANQKFSFFDTHGHAVTLTGAQVVDNVAHLHYTYDTAVAATHRTTTAAAPLRALAASVPPAPQEPHLIGATSEPLQLAGEAHRVVVGVDQPAHQVALARLAPEATPRLFLNIEDIDAKQAPGNAYGIYVNLPDDATTDDEALHHVGNLSLFGIERSRKPAGDECGHGMRVTMDITDVASALKARGEWDPANVHVSFRPLSLTLADPDDEAASDAASAVDAQPVTVGRISLFSA